jgi:diaminopimelate decarboxylase
MKTQGAAPRDARNLPYSEHIRPGPEGHLEVEGVDSVELAERFGTPLFVLSESQVRANYRRIRDAYQRRYTENSVTILYAVKANNNLAVRRILSQEGAGGDCFGLGEIHGTLLGGADPKKLVLNGANKSDPEMEIAAKLGMQVHVETVEDIERLDEIARRVGRRARAKIRIKPELPELRGVYGVWSATRSIDEEMQRYKWGATYEAALGIVEAAERTEHVELVGLHCHQGRQLNNPAFFVPQMRAMVEFAARLRDESGWLARIFDVGGGYPSLRDPVSRGETHLADPVDVFAEAMVNALTEALAAYDVPPPALELEPGRYIVENAEVLLTRVGTIKRGQGHLTWVNVDASFNHLLETYTDLAYHHVVAADRVDAEATDELLQIVGPTCYIDILADERHLPPLARGDLLAFLDVGAYGEVFATQFNGLPRPATVLVTNGEVNVIKERESIQDVFAHHSIPPHLLV